MICDYKNRLDALSEEYNNKRHAIYEELSNEIGATVILYNNNTFHMAEPEFVATKPEAEWNYHSEFFFPWTVKAVVDGVTFSCHTTDEEHDRFAKETADDTV